jgi:hypothetical protein
VGDENHVAAEGERRRHQCERQRGHRDAMDAGDREQISQSDALEPGRREQRQRGHRGALLGDRGRDRSAERVSYARDGLESESFDPPGDVIGVGVDRVLERRLRPPKPGRSKATQGRCVPVASPSHPAEESSRPWSRTSGPPSPGQHRTRRRRPPATKTSSISQVVMASCEPRGTTSASTDRMLSLAIHRLGS